MKLHNMRFLEIKRKRDIANRNKIKMKKVSELNNVTPGDLVFVQWKRREKKEFEANEGPCRIRKLIGSNCAIVENLENGRNFQVDLRFFKWCYSKDGSI